MSKLGFFAGYRQPVHLRDGNLLPVVDLVCDLSQCQYIFNAVFCKLLQQMVNFFTGAVNARQMGHRSDAILFLQPFGNGNRMFTVAAATGTEGDTDKIGAQIL